MAKGIELSTKPSPSTIYFRYTKGKFTKKISRNLYIKVTTKLGRVYTDLGGPFSTRSTTGHAIYILITNKATGKI